MTLRGVDLTGAAYLTVIGLAGLVAYGIYVKASAAADALPAALSGLKAAGAAAVDAVNPASQNNLVNQGSNAALSSIIGRPTSLGSLIADVLPSPAEVQVNNMLNGATPQGDWYPDDLPSPAFIGTVPDDLSQPAIFFRKPQ